MSLGSSGSEGSLATSTHARRSLSGIQEVAVAQHKLNELFQLWFSLPETEELLHSIVDDVKAGRQVELPPPAAHPVSPSVCPSTFSSPSQQPIAAGPVRAPPLSPSRARADVHQSPSPPHVFTFGACHAMKFRRSVALGEGCDVVSPASVKNCGSVESKWPRSRLFYSYLGENSPL